MLKYNKLFDLNWKINERQIIYVKKKNFSHIYYFVQLCIKSVALINFQKLYTQYFNFLLKQTLSIQV